MIARFVVMLVYCLQGLLTFSLMVYREACLIYCLVGVPGLEFNNMF